MPRPAIQPRGSAIYRRWQEHRRGDGSIGSPRQRVFQGHPHRGETASHDGRRAPLPSPQPGTQHPVGRRAATPQDGILPQAVHPAHRGGRTARRLRHRRTHRRPAPQGRAPPHRPVRAHGGHGQHRLCHRAQHRRHQGRRPRHRTRPRRRRPGRHHHLPRHPPRDEVLPHLRHRPLPLIRQQEQQLIPKRKQQ